MEQPYRVMSHGMPNPTNHYQSAIIPYSLDLGARVIICASTACQPWKRHPRNMSSKRSTVRSLTNRPGPDVIVSKPSHDLTVFEWEWVDTFHSYWFRLSFSSTTWRSKRSCKLNQWLWKVSTRGGSRTLNQTLWVHSHFTPMGARNSNSWSNLSQHHIIPADTPAPSSVGHQQV